MKYCTLGRSGLRISRLCLGAMTFGAGTGIWGAIAGLDRTQATRLWSWQWSAVSICSIRLMAIRKGCPKRSSAKCYVTSGSMNRVCSSPRKSGFAPALVTTT
jgi:hypothetical protein